MSDNMTIIEQNSEINRKRPHDEEIIEWTETVKTLGHIPILYNGEDHYDAIVIKGNYQDDFNQNKRKYSGYDSLSTLNYEMKSIKPDGNCFFNSILENCPKNLPNQESYLMEKRISNEEPGKRMLFLRNVLADHMNNLTECEQVYKNDDIEKVRKAGAYNFEAFDAAVTIGCEFFSSLLNKNIYIYEENKATSTFNRISTNFKDKDDDRQCKKRKCDTNPKYNHNIEIQDEFNYDSVNRKNYDDTVETINIDQEMKDNIQKYREKSIDLSQLYENIKGLMPNEDKRTICEKLAQELNKPVEDEISVKPCENTPTMSEIKKLIDDIETRKRERFCQIFDDLKSIVENTKGKTELACTLTKELHVPNLTYETWSNRLKSTNVPGKSHNVPRTDDLSSLGIEDKPILHKCKDSERFFIKENSEKIMIIRNSVDRKLVHKISVFDPNQNGKDKYTQLSSFLPPSFFYDKWFWCNSEEDRTVNPFKVNNDADLKEHLDNGLKLTTKPEKRPKIQKRIDEILEEKNQGILVNGQIISSHLWNFLSLQTKFSSEFFSDILKVEELCKVDENFRFSIVEWIALSKKVEPQPFHGIIYGLVQSGKTDLAWLLLYVHTILFDEKTILCGPNDNGIMEQNMNGFNDVILKNFVNEVDQQKKEEKQNKLREQFFEGKTNDGSLKRYINSKGGCCMFMKNESTMLTNLYNIKELNIDNLYFDEAHEIFSAMMTIYKNCLTQIFGIHNVDDVAGKIKLTPKDESVFRPTDFGTFVNLKLSESSKKTVQYEVEKQILNQNINTIGFQVVEENDKKYYFEVEFDDSLLRDQNFQKQSVIAPIPAVKQRIWEKIINKVKKRIGYISGTPDAVYNGLDSFSFMRFLSPKENYKSPYYLNHDKSTTTNDSVQTINLNDKSFKWWDGSENLTVKTITRLIKQVDGQNKIKEKFNNVFEDIAEKYEKYITDCSYHLPYLSVGVNIFRNKTDQEKFKTLMNHQTIMCNGKTYRLKAHTVNSDRKKTIASVFNDFENNKNVKEQNAFHKKENEPCFPRFCNDEVDKKFYEDEELSEDRYENIIHVVISDDMNKRGIANRPERYKGDGGHFAFIQMLKGQNANAETNIQYCRCAMNGHIFEKHCKYVSCNDNFAPPTYVYEDGYMETIRQFIKNNLKLCEKAFDEDFYETNSKKNLKDIKKEMKLVVTNNSDIEMLETRPNMHHQTFESQVTKVNRFSLGEVKENIGKLWEIYKICGFSLFTEKKKCPNTLIDTLRTNGLWDYFFDENSQFVVMNGGRLDEILKKMLEWKETYRLEIQEVISSENVVPLTELLGECDQTDEGSDKSLLSYLRTNVFPQNTKTSSIEHIKKKNIGVKDLLRSYKKFGKDYMVHYTSEDKVGIWKFNRPPIYLNCSNIYRIKDTYFKFSIDGFGSKEPMEIDCFINYCICFEKFNLSLLHADKTSSRRIVLDGSGLRTISFPKNLFDQIHEKTSGNNISCSVSETQFKQIFKTSDVIQAGHCEEISSNTGEKLIPGERQYRWTFTVKTDQEINETREQKLLKQEHVYLCRQLKNVFNNAKFFYVPFLREILMSNDHLKDLENITLSKSYLEKKKEKDQIKNVWNSYSTKYNPEITNTYAQLFVKSKKQDNYIINPKHRDCIKKSYDEYKKKKK
jgi:hypothetical protein